MLSNRHTDRQTDRHTDPTVPSLRMRAEGNEVTNIEKMLHLGSFIMTGISISSQDKPRLELYIMIMMNGLNLLLWIHRVVDMHRFYAYIQTLDCLQVSCTCQPIEWAPSKANLSCSVDFTTFITWIIDIEHRDRGVGG